MHKLYIILLLLSFSQLSLPHYFTVSLNDYILLSQNYSGISTIAKDFEGNFLVGFLDGTARKYTADFSSYSNISLPAVVGLFEVRQLIFSLTLANGTSIHINTRKTVITFINFITIADYDYNTYALQETFNLNATVISQLGFPLTVSSVTHTYHAIISTNSVIVAYKGAIISYNYAIFFGAIMTCTIAIHDSYSFSTSSIGGSDYFFATNRFYASFGNSVYKVTVKLTFIFNHTANHFDLSPSQTAITKSLIYTSSSPITYLSIANGLMIMQSNSTGLSYIYDINSLTSGTTSGVSTDQIFNFFYIHGGYYVLQSTGILELIYDPTSIDLYLSYTSATLPYNTYSLQLGTPINAFYIPGFPYVYKAGLCPGQDYMRISDQVCISFNCLDTNCSWCPFSETMCSICNTGFILDYNYTCQLNITIPNNTIPTNTTQIIAIYYKSFFEQLLQFLFNIIKFLISIPTARRVISPVFYFFGVFDDIYLFQFHDRIYGQTMNNVFDNLNDIQQKKWSLLSYQNILKLFNVNQNSFKMTTDYQDAYEEFHFTDINHAQMNPEGLWANCQNFFIVALPITTIGFLCGRMLFKLFFNSIISRLFRRFDFWSLFILLLFDGNIQQFAFYQATDWKNMFFFGVSSKAIKLQTIIFGFLLVLISSVLYFLSYSLYLKPNKYIMDNNKNNILGQGSLIIQFGLRNCFLGILNSYLRALQYKHMLTVLLIIQIVLMALFIVSFSMNIYESNLKMWIYILLNFTKILLIITLFVDYLNINLLVIETVQRTLIIIEIITFLFGSLLETYLTLKDIYRFIQTIIKYKQRNSPRYLKKELSRKGIVAYVENIESKFYTTSKMNERGEEKQRNKTVHFKTSHRLKRQHTFKSSLKIINKQ